MQDRKFKHDVVYRCYKSFTDYLGDRARKGQRFKLRDYSDGNIVFEKASGRGMDIIFKEEEAHQYLCPQYDYPVDIPEFRIGDRVKIATTSDFYRKDDDSNPLNIKGIICEIKDKDVINLNINVKWDNGKVNAYNSVDLELAKQPSYIHTEEKIINHLKPNNPKVMINAIAITDVEQIKALCEAIPSIKEQVQAMYPDLFEAHKAGNTYLDELGEAYILATESGAVALVDLGTGKIGKTVHVNDVNNITSDEMKRVYDGKEYELA
jgi:hypothetical protein